MNADGALDFGQAILLAIIQGITELFPVSSLGHAVLLPHLLGWNVDQESGAYLPFLVMLHLGTAIALLLFFWREWLSLFGALVRHGPSDEARTQRRLLLLLVIGTIPAGLIGLIFEKRLAGFFADFRFAAGFLIVNGVILLAGEWLRLRARNRKLDQVRPWQAAAIGTAQAIALLPGLSRSGATMVGGLAVGLSHAAAARFSFLLATPIIGAAALLELPKFARSDVRQSLGPALAGGIVAGVLAYLSTAFLMRYFRQNELNALVPFGVYCLIVGSLGLFIGH